MTGSAAGGIDAKGTDDGLFILITGCPRSGTNLIAQRVSRRFAIAIPYETHFIPIFQRWLWLYGDLNKPKNRERLLRAIFRFQELWLQQSFPGDRERLSRFSLLSVKECMPTIAANTRSYAEMVSAIFQAFAEQAGVTRSGDKSVFFLLEPMDRVDEGAPKAKVLHVIRDGRDVCSSWMRTWFGPANVVEAAYQWRTHVMDVRDWGRRHPDRYAEVRYEDFLEDDERELSRLQPFIEDRGETMPGDWNEEMATTLSAADEYRLVSDDINRGNKGNWQTRLSDTDIARIEGIAGDLLAELGYPLAVEPSDRDVPGKLHRFREMATVNSAKRHFKRWLPLPLYFWP